MSHIVEEAVVDRAPSRLPVPEGLRRAVAELEAVRAGMENAFDVVHSHAAADAHQSPRYLVAMQSIDALSQQIAAIERFLLNLSGEFADEHHVDSHVASAGITLSAVVSRLTAAYDPEHPAGECDFF